MTANGILHAPGGCRGGVGSVRKNRMVHLELRMRAL
jgi:hypothetical protein